MLKDRIEKSFFVIKVGDLYLANQFVIDRVNLSNSLDEAEQFNEDYKELIQRQVSRMVIHGLKDIKIVKVIMVNETFEEHYQLEHNEELKLIKAKD